MTDVYPWLVGVDPEFHMPAEVQDVLATDIAGAITDASAAATAGAAAAALSATQADTASTAAQTAADSLAGDLPPVVLAAVTAADIPGQVAASNAGKAPVTAKYLTTPTGGDDTALIQGVIDSAGADEIVRITGTYRIDSTVFIKGNFDGSGAVFNYPAAGGGIAVQYAQTASEGQRKVTFPRVNITGRGPSGWIAGTIGIKILKTYASIITIPEIAGFETGLLLYGNADGVSYNTLLMGRLNNNKRNMVFDNLSSAGWVNQNTVIGGRFSHSSAEGLAVAGTVHVAMLGPYPSNNNVFMGSSFESPGVVEYMLDIQNGSYNLFTGCRYEMSTGTAKVRWGAGALRNQIQQGYATDSITVTRTGGSSRNTISGTSSYQFELTNEPGIVIENTGSSDMPALTVLRGGGGAAGDSPATAYAGRLTANRWALKQYSDANDRINISSTGKIYVGQGASPAVCYFGAYGSTSMVFAGGSVFFSTGTKLLFVTDNVDDVGATAANRPRSIYAGTNVVAGNTIKTGVFATGSRPSAATSGVGAMVFDSTLGKPIWSDGTVWRDAAQTAV